MPPPQPPRPAQRPPASRPLVREETASVPPAVKRSLAEAREANDRAFAELSEAYERRLQDERLRNESELQERDAKILELSAKNLETSEAVLELRGDIERRVTAAITVELSKRFPDRPEVKAISGGEVRGERGKLAGLSAIVSAVVVGVAMAGPAVMKSCNEPPKSFDVQAPLPQSDPSLPHAMPRK